MIFSTLCIDTGNYETRQDPHINSVRLYRIEASSALEAELLAVNLLRKEFSSKWYDWRVFTTEQTMMFSTDGKLIPIIDKVEYQKGEKNE